MIPLAEVLEEEAAETAGTRLLITGLSTLPEGAEEPRTVVAGVDGDLEPLTDLFARLQKSLATIGYKPEKRPFHPHVTLARIKGAKNLDRLIERVAEAKRNDYGYLQVNEIQLMMSDLEAEGPFYTPLQSFPLLG